MSHENQIEEIVKIVRRLTFDLRTNMTSITRYVKHERSKRPTLTEGQFIDQHLKYRELANVAVDNILKCINDNEELRQIENMRFEDYQEQIDKNEGIWLFDDYDECGVTYKCSHCGHLVLVPNKTSPKPMECPKCKVKMR